MLQASFECHSMSGSVKRLVSPEGRRGEVTLPAPAEPGGPAAVSTPQSGQVAKRPEGGGRGSGVVPRRPCPHGPSIETVNPCPVPRATTLYRDRGCGISCGGGATVSRVPCEPVSLQLKGGGRSSSWWGRRRRVRTGRRPTVVVWYDGGRLVVARRTARPTRRGGEIAQGVGQRGHADRMVDGARHQVAVTL